MHLQYPNINVAFENMVAGIHSGEIPTIETNSRNGSVLQVVEPTIVTYQRPLERVLFNQARDANPFFHLYEALWMLAGRNDLAPLQYYVSTFDQFSDDGKTLNGAYGYRWRCALDYMRHVTVIARGNPDFQDIEGLYGSTFDSGVDQLNIIINHLKTNPNSRRAVLQMWNVEDDLLKIGPDIEHPETPCDKCNGTGVTPGTESIYCKFCSGTKRSKKAWTEVVTSKDVCCNTHAYFSIRTEITSEIEPKGRYFSSPQEALEQAEKLGWDKSTLRKSVDSKHWYLYNERIETKYLDMTVCNRSNDMILGMLGANVVHFSFLQEYMAHCIGVEVGVYNQFTNNLHVYTNNWKPQDWLAEAKNRDMHSPQQITYGKNVETMVPLVKNAKVFDSELSEFVDIHSSGPQSMMNGQIIRRWKEPFLFSVAEPMLLAFHYHKARRYNEAFLSLAEVDADDWRLAGKAWLNKRATAWEKKRGRTS